MSRRSSRRGAAGNDYAQRLKSAQNPTANHESAEKATHHGVSGHYVNKQEAESSHKGAPLSSYQVFNDSQPEVIRKKATNCPAGQKNNNTLKALKQCENKPVGDIIIEEAPAQEAQAQAVAPPVHLVIPGKDAQGCKKETKFREQAPQAQQEIAQKVIRIPNRNPAAQAALAQRQLIVEQLPDAPNTSSENIHVERWLAAPARTRKVIFKPAAAGCAAPAPPTPKNLHIIWEPCTPENATNFEFLGVDCGSPQAPAGYAVVSAAQLPEFAKRQAAPNGERWASDVQGEDVPKLVGDLEALKLVDLDREGRGEYRAQLHH